MFIVSLTYTCDISIVEKHLSAHLAYLNKYYQLGKFVLSGRKVPRTGGVILVNANSLDELQQILREDPFAIAQVADYEVTEFVPTMSAKGLELLKE